MRNPWSKMTKRGQRRVIATILFILILASIIYYLAARGEPESEIISYSDFIGKVEKGEVSKVNIIRDYIIVTFLDGRSFKVLVNTNYVKPVEDLKKYEVDILFPEPDPTDSYIFLAALLIILLLFTIWLYFFFWGIGPNGEIYWKVWQTRAWLAKQEAKNNKVTFSDVAGIDEAKAELQEVVEFLKNPKRFQRLGAKIPKGILMIGPPGTGKTLLAKAVSGEAKVPFFSIAGSEFVEMFVGVGARRVRDLFDNGKANSPCIIFIDEIDAACGKRTTAITGSDREDNKTVTQFLTEMDGFETADSVIVMASTNRPDSLDPALLRPGRFDRKVFVPLPDTNGREAILKVHARKIIIDPELDFHKIAKIIPGYSGADCANLVNEAALLATRNEECNFVSYDHFVRSRDTILLGPERKSHKRIVKEIAVSIKHESGHTVVAACLKYADRLEKVTTVSRGFTGGVTYFVYNEASMLFKKKMIAGIITGMGGRAAEKLFLDDITTGARNDFENASKMVRDLVCVYGMSSLGPISMDTGSQSDLRYGSVSSLGGTYSEKLKQEVDDICQKISSNAMICAEKILQHRKDFFYRLAEQLTEQETVEGEDIYALAGRYANTITIDDLENIKELEKEFEEIEESKTEL